MKAILASHSRAVCASSPWKMVPCSENVWCIKDGFCLKGYVKSENGVRPMSSHEIEIKLQFLQNSPQFFGEMQFSHSESSLGFLSLPNWERIIYEDERYYVFEFSGRFPK